MRIALRYKLMTPRESYSSTDSNSMCINMCISICSGGSVGIILRISYTLAQTPCQEKGLACHPTRCTNVFCLMLKQKSQVKHSSQSSSCRRCWPNTPPTPPPGSEISTVGALLDRFILFYVYPLQSLLCDIQRDESVSIS